MVFQQYSYSCGPHKLQWGLGVTPLTVRLENMPAKGIGITCIARYTDFDEVVDATRRGFYAAKNGCKLVRSEEQWRAKKPKIFYDSMSHLKFNRQQKEIDNLCRENTLDISASQKAKNRAAIRSLKKSQSESGLRTFSGETARSSAGTSCYMELMENFK